MIRDKWNSWSEGEWWSNNKKAKNHAAKQAQADWEYAARGEAKPPDNWKGSTGQQWKGQGKPWK